MRDLGSGGGLRRKWMFASLVSFFENGLKLRCQQREHEGSFAEEVNPLIPAHHRISSHQHGRCELRSYFEGPADGLRR